MNLDIRVDAAAVTKALGELQKQARFATSKALNDTANDAQRAIQDSLAQKFTLRRPDFIKRTIKRERPNDFATKDNLVATVRVDPKRDILAKFEDGGEKVPTKGKALAIPTLSVRRTKADVIQKSQRPRALLSSGKAFVRGAAIVQKARRVAGGLGRILYIFKARVRIDNRLHFVDTATQSVEATWAARAIAAVDRAINTIR